MDKIYEFINIKREKLQHGGMHRRVTTYFLGTVRRSPHSFFYRGKRRTGLVRGPVSAFKGSSMGSKCVRLQVDNGS